MLESEDTSLRQLLAKIQTHAYRLHFENGPSSEVNTSGKMRGVQVEVLMAGLISSVKNQLIPL